MLRKLLLTALLLGISNAPAQAQRRTSAIETVYPAAQRQEFRIAHDPWVGADKFIDHFALAFVLTAAADAATFAKTPDAEARVFYWGAAFWTANEVKDAILPWEQVGWVGGDGFSYRDLLWSLAGTGLALMVF